MEYEGLIFAFGDSVKSCFTNASPIDLGGLIVDNVSRDSPLASLPIVKWFLDAHRIGSYVRDRFLLKKTLVYLRELQEGKLTQEKSEVYIYRLGNEVFAEEELERVLAILDSVVELEQVRWMARCHGALACGAIDLEMFHELTEIARRMFAGDEVLLARAYRGVLDEPAPLPRYRLKRLESQGLLEVRMAQTWRSVAGDGGDIVTGVEVTSFGKLFCEHCLGC